MKCNIGQDQKPLQEDLTQLDHTCTLLNQKDSELYKQLMPQNDEIQKKFLANQVSNGLRMIMYSDKVDIEQHIEFNNSGMEKLLQMTDKQQSFIDNQNEHIGQQQKQIEGTDDQINLLSNEKQAILLQIQRHKDEYVRLQQLLAQKK